MSSEPNIKSIGPNDIEKERERNGVTTYWISQEFLLRVYNDLSEKYLAQKARYEYSESLTAGKRKKDTPPDTGRAWRFSRRHGKFYYAYKNIPNQKPTYYQAGLGDPETLMELAQKAVKSDRLEELEILVKERIEETAEGYWQYYLGYNGDQMQRLARACAALDVCIEIGRERGLIGCRSAAWYQDYGAVLDRLQINYLPSNWRRLKEKVEAVLTGGQAAHEVVVLPRGGNQNARKFDDTEIESWVIQMRGMSQNFTSAMITRKVRQMCDLTGKPIPSESWLAGLLAAPATKFLTADGRFGERGRLGQVYKGYTPMRNALFAGDAWQADGTRVNFLPWKDANGYDEFLYIVVIRDVHSGAILGASFGKENRWAYLSALGMAVKLTGYLPYELILDRFPGHNTDEWRTVENRMKAVGSRVSYKHTATGKAQLERWFETLQSVFFQTSPFYYGEGIQSKRPAAHRSAEYLSEAKKVARREAWGYDPAVREALRCIAEYNETALNTYSRKHSAIAESPLQLHDKSAKPHVRTISDWQRVMLFGLMKRVTIRNQMIRTEIQGTEYLYQIADYEILKHHKQVLLAYHFDDLSKVYLFVDGDENAPNPKCLGAVDILERVQVYGPDADMKALGRDTKRRNDINNRRKEDLAAIKGAGSEVNLMLAGMGRKSEAEAAESGYLMESMTTADEAPRVLTLNSQEEPDELQQSTSAGQIDEVAFMLSQM